MVGVVSLALWRSVDEMADSHKLLPRHSTRRKMHQLVAKEKKFDPEDEDYAVEKGEEHKETIAKVWILLVSSCLNTIDI